MEARQPPPVWVMDQQRGMFQIILAAVQRVQELADDQQRGIAGVVVNVLQAQLGNLTAAVAQHLHVVPLRLHRGLQQPELGDGHVGDEDGVGGLHFFGKFGIGHFHGNYLVSGWAA